MAKIMRFILINNSKNFGGQERYIQILHQSLVELGYDVDLSTKILQETEVNHSSASDRMPLLVYNGNRALYLHAWKRRKNCHRIYIQHSDLADRQAGYLKFRLRILLLKLLLKRVSLIIRVCKSSIPNGFVNTPIRTIYNGVYLPELPENRGTTKSSLTLLMVGTMTENKNQILALRVLRSLPTVKLILVGDGPKKSEWQAWCDEQGLSNRVQWTGHVKDPSPYYREADALLMLSRYEAFPFCVLEAMSFGIPVISTRAGGVAEILADGENGVFLERADEESLAQAIERLINNPDSLAAMGTKARTTIENGFTVKHMTDNFLAAVTEELKVDIL